MSGDAKDKNIFWDFSNMHRRYKPILEQDGTLKGVTWTHSRNPECRVLSARDVHSKENPEKCTWLENLVVDDQGYIVFSESLSSEWTEMAYRLYDHNRIVYHRHIFFHIPKCHGVTQENLPDLMLGQ